MMKRPVMNPSYLDEDHKPSPRKQSRWRAVQTVVKFVWRIVRVLFMDVFRRNKSKIKDETGTPTSRFLKAVLYRLMFVPTVVAVLVCVFVVTATHPKAAVGLLDPSSQGVYYDPVELLSLDGTKLEAQAGAVAPLVTEIDAVVTQLTNQKKDLDDSDAALAKQLAASKDEASKERAEATKANVELEKLVDSLKQIRSGELGINRSIATLGRAVTHWRAALRADTLRHAHHLNSG